MEPGKPMLRRCAIYTRKSSDEGLEQNFNSLHAQREACEAFIKSQAAETPHAGLEPITRAGRDHRPGVRLASLDIDR
jgi:site-specific DNA recombinase